MSRSSKVVSFVQFPQQNPVCTSPPYVSCPTYDNIRYLSITTHEEGHAIARRKENKEDGLSKQVQHISDSLQVYMMCNGEDYRLYCTTKK